MTRPYLFVVVLLGMIVTSCQISGDTGGNQVEDEVAVNVNAGELPAKEVTEVPLPTATTVTRPPTATNTPESGAAAPEGTETPAGGAANADVVFVRATQAPDGTWTFRVTVEHPDTGWEDYADGWDVVTPDGVVLKRNPDDPFSRLLLHPHENEQPFRRSQSGLTIPAGITQVTVRAHDLVDGYGGKEVIVDLSATSGPGFEVERNDA